MLAELIRGIYVVMGLSFGLIAFCWGVSAMAGNYCLQQCLNINQSAYLPVGQNATGYIYTENDNSCWTCGSGSPGNGWCQNPPSNQTCSDQNQVIYYQFGKVSGMECNIGNAYNQASVYSPSGPAIEEEQYLCVRISSSQ